MKLLIFRTDIKTKKKVQSLKPLFNNHATITNWSVDLEDVDKVLKIKAAGNLKESEVIDIINAKGFHCEVLAD